MTLPVAVGTFRKGWIVYHHAGRVVCVFDGPSYGKTTVVAEGQGVIEGRAASRASRAVALAAGAQASVTDDDAATVHPASSRRRGRLITPAVRSTRTLAGVLPELLRGALALASLIAWTLAMIGLVG